MTKVTLQNDQQYRATIPIGLAEAMNLEGAELDWEVKSKNKIEVTIER